MSDIDPFVVTYVIMAVTVAVSYFCFEDRSLFERLKHSPYRESNHGEWYRLLTSGFVHASWLHLGVNMFVFYSFGRFTEAALKGYVGGLQEYRFDGWAAGLVYLGLYLLTIVIANVGTLLQHRDNPRFGAIGASGAVSGVLFCTVLFQPWDKIYLYAVIPIYSIVAAVLFVLYSQYAANRGTDNVDHSAHLYGALAMPILLLLLRPGLVGHFVEQLTANRPF